MVEPNHAAVSKAWRALLEGLGYDVGDEHLRESPDRVARFLCDWHTQTKEPPKITKFANLTYDEVVAVSGITFHSMCAHHGLPFFGYAAAAYLPGSRIAGLSKLARVVDHFAHRFQTQEGITSDVASYLQRELEARGVGVVLRAEHLCMSMRGVLKPGALTTTSDLRGSFREDAAARAELLALVSR